MQEYTTIYDRAEDSFIERKSEFIGHIAPVETEEQALAFIAEIKKKHHDATHNTHAYILRNGVKRYSDDGEPQGTAGVPMLDCIEKEGLVDVAVVVTRYFGGILLGAGGLVRAYTQSAKDALDAAGISVVRRWVEAELRVPYSLFERARQETEAAGGLVDGAEYGADVTLRVLLPEEKAIDFTDRITELTAGGVVPAVTGESFKDVPRAGII